MPTSLTYIVLSTRGCSPWRPAAVMSTTERENKCLPQIFKDRRRRTGHSGKWSALPVFPPYLRLIRFQGRRVTPPEGNAKTVKKKRELFPGPSPTSLSSFASPQNYPRPGSGILTGFPFDRRRDRIAHFHTEFPYLLGSTNPYPNTVHMEPFSTSVFKVLT